MEVQSKGALNSSLKKYLVVGGALAVLASGVYIWYRARSSVSYFNVKLLEKNSFLKLLSEIRESFSSDFAVLQRLNRKKRRKLNRGGREYRNCVRELKEQAKRTLQRAIDETLAKHNLNEQTLNQSYKYLENDVDVRVEITRLCSVVDKQSCPLLTRDKLEEILEFYISSAENFSEEDPNELNVKMKILEDEVFQEYGYEPENVEQGAKKHEVELRELILAVRELNYNLLEKTNQELF